MRRSSSVPLLSLILAATVAVPLAAQPSRVYAELDRRVETVNSKVVAWRRDIHEHPELGNQETRTAALVAAHLKGLGMEVRTGVGGTGVVGILRGGRPGRVVALRADMDGLPEPGTSITVLWQRPASADEGKWRGPYVDSEEALKERVPRLSIDLIRESILRQFGSSAT